MAEDWSEAGLEQIGTGSVVVQGRVSKDSSLQSHDRLDSDSEHNHGIKERGKWRSKRRQETGVNRHAWHKNENSFSDPEQGTSGGSYKDRMRNIKFTEEENDLLVTKVLENYSKLYGDDASRTSNFEKKRTWRDILESINGLGVSVRNVDTCKKRFADCKRFVRAKMTKHWRRPGSRQALNVYYADWEEKIKSVLCPVTDGIPGLIDSADPCTYECPGRWSPREPPSPEAQLSPDEEFTLEGQYFPETQTSAEQKLEATEDEWTDFKEQLAVKVKEEISESTSEFQTEEDIHHDPETLGQRLSESTSKGEGFADICHLLYQSQEAFHRSVRQQLHAVRQELREFRRDHIEKMDLLLNIQKEHIAIEEQRNQILSQLVSTVNHLATNVGISDLTKEKTNTPPQVIPSSNDTAKYFSTRIAPSDSHLPHHTISQINKGANRTGRKKRELHDGTPTHKKK
ncbi:uncharacterized protein LOC143943289 [Lithobates pipiens]